jgi:rhodanese-related sulfurtransferase
MRKTLPVVFFGALFLLMFSLFAGGHALAGTDDVRRVTKEDLKSLLDDPNTVIIDVRQGVHWQDSDRKIKGAVRQDPMDEFSSWAKKYPKDKNIVLYCA